MRFFVAIEMNEAIRHKAKEIMTELQKTGCDVKWVEEENLHITLKFIGEQPEEMLPKIKDALAAAASACQKFTIDIAGVGSFPGGKSPRVIWMGATGEIDKAVLLAQKVDAELSLLGVQKEAREFSAHLTLGRVRTPKNLPKLSESIADMAKNETAYGIRLEVNSFTFLLSKLSPRGPAYTALRRFGLK